MSQPSAHQRAQLILQVQAGQMTATEAARQLGLSRKSYYQWEQRGLAALLQSQEQQPPGRPSQATDPQKEQWRRQVTQLQAKVTELEQIMELRRTVQQLQASDAKKNSRSCKPSSSKRAPPSPPPG